MKLVVCGFTLEAALIQKTYMIKDVLVVFIPSLFYIRHTYERIIQCVFYSIVFLDETITGSNMEVCLLFLSRSNDLLCCFTVIITIHVNPLGDSLFDLCPISISKFGIVMILLGLVILLVIYLISLLKNEMRSSSLVFQFRMSRELNRLFNLEHYRFCVFTAIIVQLFSLPEICKLKRWWGCSSDSCTAIGICCIMTKSGTRESTTGFQLQYIKEHNRNAIRLSVHCKVNMKVSRLRKQKPLNYLQCFNFLALIYIVD